MFFAILNVTYSSSGDRGKSHRTIHYYRASRTANEVRQYLNEERFST
ncbi:hypothetical protein LQK30_001474 [Vibrio vulnificus]|nr:hypothetical protein [Vibrio vulnificus]ELH9431233.1 hypothetical protein [Vibrio vulnificus]